MAIPPVLRALLTAHGPSGYETAPAAAFRDAASAYAEVTTDVMGSVWARVPGTADGPDAGHRRPHRRDRPDRHAHRRQRLPALHGRRRLGPADPRRPARQRGHARGARSRGVVGRKPIHLLKDDDRKKVARLEELHIDIGAKDGDEARALVRIGDVAVIEGEPVELPNDRAVARSMDNRLGCYVAYEAARLVHEAGGAPGDVVAVAAVQEETTLRRLARRRPTRCAPTWPSWSTSPTPPTRPASTSTSSARTRSARARSSSAARTSTRASSSCSTRPPRPRRSPSRSRPPRAHTGTDVDAMHFSRGGIPCGGIGLPLRYMHSPVEMVQLDDVANAARAHRRGRAAPDRGDELRAVTGSRRRARRRRPGARRLRRQATSPAAADRSRGRRTARRRPARPRRAGRRADRRPARRPARRLPLRRAHAAAGAARAHPPRRGRGRHLPGRQPRHAGAGARAHAHAAARPAAGRPARAAAAHGRPGGRQRAAPAGRAVAQRAGDGGHGAPRRSPSPRGARPRRRCARRA